MILKNLCSSLDEKKNKIVFKQVWLNFENILSVWKWLKIIVSIAISMSCQKIYVSSIFKQPIKYRICQIVIFKIKGKNICSWRIGIVNTKYPKKGWLYEIEDSHYGWDFAYSINVEQDKVIPQRPSPVNTLVLHSHHLEESTPSSLEVKGWREKVIMMELIVDTLKYLRLTWWCRDCDHGIQTLLTKKGVKMTFWKNTFLTSNFKNDRKWQVLIIFSGRYCGYICIVK